MTYRFKGKGILWEEGKGPVVWWPINWFWFLVTNFEEERRQKREEAAEASAAVQKDADSAKAEEPAAAQAEAPAAPPVETAVETPASEDERVREAALAASAVAADPVVEVAGAPAEPAADVAAADPAPGTEPAEPPPQQGLRRRLARAFSAKAGADFAREMRNFEAWSIRADGIGSDALGLGFLA
ncbi:MAG: hypothetical protein HC829_00965 [Bacteroidales bacterium]|nr:hypothetical protein [Bacteroidales bacterium]